MEILHYLLIIFLGLVFGSFGSVIFFRLGDLPTRKTLKGFLRGRSECRYCHHTLHAKDLVPIFSFLFQKGKCRYCKKKLSRRYPTLEIWTMIIFLLSFLLIGISNLPLLIFTAILSRLLRIILLYDFKTYELHLSSTILLLLISFIGQRQMGFSLLSALQSMLIFFAVFLAIYLLAKGYVYLKYKKNAEGFWFGDVLMGGVLWTLFPMFITFSSARVWGYTLCIYLMLSCSIGILLYFVMLLLPKPNSKDISITKQKGVAVIPFLPAMIIAFYVFLLRGNQLLALLLP